MYTESGKVNNERVSVNLFMSCCLYICSHISTVDEGFLKAITIHLIIFFERWRSERLRNK